MWRMSGWTEKAERGWTESREQVVTFVEAESMDEAFKIARSIYGDGIDTAQAVGRSK